MKVLVCGSRDWADASRLIDRMCQLSHDTVVIHGAARGADDLAAITARRLGLEERAYPADWRGKGKRAGIIRNVEMLDEQPDLVLAFQRNGSRGTQHTIDEARRRGIPVEVHTA